MFSIESKFHSGCGVSLNSMLHAPPDHETRSIAFMPRPAVIFSVLAALVLAVGYVFFMDEPRQTYLTAPVERGSILNVVKATGTVNPVLTITVGSYVSGIIQQVLCDYNTEVKQGQLCAKIDPRTYQSVINQAKATLAVAKAQLKKDQANLAYSQLAHERQLRLSQTNAVSRDALDNAKNVFDQAQAQVELDQAMIEQREADVAAAEVNLNYTDIVSPVDGTVVSRKVTMGQTVASSFQTPTLFTIAKNLREMQVEGKIDEADVGRLKVGQAATFTVDAFPDRTFDGRVMEIRKAPEVVQNVVTYTAIVSAPNPELLLLPGMTANLSIAISDTGAVLKIPNQALRFRPKEARSSPGVGTVWVLDADGNVSAVTVKPGASDSAGTQVISGQLSEGQKVIIGIAAPDKRSGLFGLRVGL
jgi:HlyD family secretion protein